MIKNIIFDIDGVLTNTDKSYYNFLRTLPEYTNLKYAELPKLLPMEPDNGAIEMSGEFGTAYFHSPFFCDRPLFENTLETLQNLKAKGLRLFTLSASSSPQKKLPWLKNIFGNIFEEYEFSPAGLPKDNSLLELLKKHHLNKEETLFVEDRIFNIKAGLKAGVKVIRRLPDFYLPLPPDLDFVKSISNLEELEQLIEIM